MVTGPLADHRIPLTGCLTTAQQNYQGLRVVVLSVMASTGTKRH